MAQADAQATFAVNLEDGTSSAALKAGDALEQLQKQLHGDTKALGDLQRAMKNLQGASSVNVAQFKALEEQIRGKKESIAQVTGSIVDLGGSLQKPSAKKLTGMLEQLQGVAGNMGEPLGMLNARFEQLQKLVAGGAVALGLVAIAAAVVAVTVATIAATAALLKYGLAQANARRAEMLRLEGLTKLRNYYGVASGSAAELQTAIDQVAGKTALGRDETAKWAAQLYKMHLRGQNLTDTLEAVAIKATVQGEAQAQMFAGWAAGAAMSGRSVKKLADDVKARLGGIAAKQMLDLDVQTKKLHESLDMLFGGLKIEGALRALNELTSLLSQNTASGRALKFIFETVFQPILDAVTGASPILKRFFQGLIIGGLYVVIAVLKLRNAFRDTFGDVGLFKGLDGAQLALYAGAALVGTLTAGVLALGAAMALAAAPVLMVAGAFYALYKVGASLVNLWASIDWSALGTSMAQGVVDGLKRGSKWVVDAVRGMGTAAWKAFRGALGIASPSKAFAQLGLQIPAGVELGVEKGTPGAQRSVAELVDVPRYPRIPAEPGPSSSPAVASAPGSSGGGGTVSLQIDQINVYASSSEAPAIASSLRSELAELLEQLLLQMGGAPAGAG